MLIAIAISLDNSKFYHKYFQNVSTSAFQSLLFPFKSNFIFFVNFLLPHINSWGFYEADSNFSPKGEFQTKIAPESQVEPILPNPISFAGL